MGGDVLPLAHTNRTLNVENIEVAIDLDFNAEDVASLGGIGVISVLSNIIPKDVHNMTTSYFEGKNEEATKLQLDTLNLTKALFCEVNPIPVKAALNMVGYNAGIPRLPLIEMSKSGQERLKDELKKYGVLK